MRFFALVDLQHMALAFFLGLGFVILIYNAWMGYPDRSPEETGQGPEEAGGVDEVPGGDKHPSHPISPMLLILYAGVLVWMLGYMIVVGIRGGPIW